MKKFMAMLLTGTMVFGTCVSSFADDPATLTQSAAGAGAIDAINTTQYRVVVPTDGKLNYKADPQGLATLANGSNAELSDLDGGNVYANGFVNIGNRSSKDIKVTVKAKAEAGTDTDKTNVGVDTFANVTADGATGKKFALALVPVEATFAVATDGTDAQDTVDSVTTKYTVTPKALAENAKYTGYELSGTDGAIDITLKRAPYKATKSDAGAVSYALAETTSVGGGVQLAIAGKTTPASNWSDYDSTKVVLPTVSVTYAFADAGEAATAAYAVADPSAGAFGTKVTDKIEKLSATTANATVELAATLSGDNIVINPATGKTFASNVFQGKYNGAFLDILGWDPKPSLNSSTGNWEVPTSLFDYLAEEDGSEGVYKFKVAYSDDAGTLLEVTYTPES